MLNQNNDKFAFIGGNYHLSLYEPVSIIKEIAIFSNCKTYLELGVSAGDTFIELVNVVPKCIGVDIIDRRKQKVGQFYNETTDQFFSHFKEKVDIIFIDANHGIEFVQRDLINSLNLLNEYGFIFMHDTDPYQMSHTLPERCGDAYKIHDYLNSRIDLTYVTLPIAITGLTIVQFRNTRRILCGN